MKGAFFKKHLQLRLAIILGLWCSVGFGLTASALTNTSNCAAFDKSNASSIPSGFGMPFNIFSSIKELLVSGVCDPTTATITVGSPGNSTIYVYEKAYVYKNGTWNPVSLSGNPVFSESGWLIGSGAVNVPKGINEDLWVVGYTCRWDGTRWKCGCRDQACGQSFWQLQAPTRN